MRSTSSPVSFGKVLKHCDERIAANLRSQSMRSEDWAAFREEDDAEVDLPAAEYNRVFAATVALLVYNVASMLVSSFTAGGLEGNLSQLQYLLWPLCWTAIFALAFGALDSAEAGRRTILLLRLWCVANLICVPLLHWAAGRVGEALFMVFQFSINIVYLPWLCDSMIKVLRRRGSPTAQAHSAPVKPRQFRQPASRRYWQT